MKLGIFLLALALVACGDDETSKSNNVINVNNGTNNTTNNTNNGTNNGTNNTNNGTNNGTNNTANNTNNTNNVVTAEEVDPSCVDGQYREALPNPGADISAELASFSTADLKGFYDSVLTKRFPVGAWVVQGGLGNPQFDCVQTFSGNPTTADDAIGSLSTVVHECGHVYDFTLPNDGYGVTPELTISCSGGDTVARGGSTFERSRLRQDTYNDKRPGCDVSGGRCAKKREERIIERLSCVGVTMTRILGSSIIMSESHHIDIARHHFEQKGYRVHSGLQFGCELC